MEARGYSCSILVGQYMFHQNVMAGAERCGKVGSLRGLLTPRSSDPGPGEVPCYFFVADAPVLLLDAASFTGRPCKRRSRGTRSIRQAVYALLSA